MKVRVGVARRDITPPPGLEMSGYAARSEFALGAHDALTVRALVIEDTALVIIDVIGIDRAFSELIAAKTTFAGAVMVIATHTHGGPVSMPGRLGFQADATYLHFLVTACLEALDEAARSRTPACLKFGWGDTPGVGKNRRQSNGPVDDSLPVLVAETTGGNPLAVLIAYGCHPVVLDARNLYWTADYPHTVRYELESRFAGAMALFATGCAGDVNTGHTAAVSQKRDANLQRSFAAARDIGIRIAQAAAGAKLEPLQGNGFAFASRELALPIAATSPKELARLQREFQVERDGAQAARRALLDHWIDWTEKAAAQHDSSYLVRVSAFKWGELGMIGLPGEIFASTGLQLRASADCPLIISGYCGDNPGYIPPREAYAAGGYEIEEAHRFYRMSGPFAPGGAEAVVAAALGVLKACSG